MVDRDATGGIAALMRRFLLGPLLFALVAVVTTARHEGSHALVASLQGSTIEEVRLLPGYDPGLGFYFGYVRHEGDTTWLVDAAPFLVDVLWLGLGALALRFVAGRGWLRFLVVLFGLVSPVIDLAYNYQGGLWRSGTDVADLFVAMPRGIVHAFFLGAIAAGIRGIALTRRADRVR